ncbi:MAG: hypothetical protein KKF12_00045 [Proteobacteria bacterium]|nr:hypothetical protein [Desulfobacula sp.]MBU3950560.1 hypothetical protein [Pseudomonadota bacterium]MBU4129187.1 hypothetical protein [Pseudomonadota bacterium]
MNRIFSFLIKGLLIVSLTFALFCVAYYFKSRLPFEFSKQYSLHQYVPFKYLVRDDTLTASGPGVIMADDFNRWHYFSRWYHIWMQEKGMVDIESSENGYQGSACFAILSRSLKSWYISPVVYIRVTPGDRLSFEAVLMKDFPEQTIRLQVIGYDYQRVMVQKKMGEKSFDPIPGQWSLTRVEVTIPSGVMYITPRIRGAGLGKTKIDNIRVSMK